MSEILFDKNAPFLLAAYGVFLGALFLYLASLRVRARNLKRDEETIRQIEDEQKNAPPDS